jgi:hypothetical protein
VLVAIAGLTTDGAGSLAPMGLTTDEAKAMETAGGEAARRAGGGRGVVWGTKELTTSGAGAVETTGSVTKEAITAALEDMLLLNENKVHVFNDQMQEMRKNEKS